MELNEAIEKLNKAGLIAEAKVSYKQFLPKDTADPKLMKLL